MLLGKIDNVVKTEPKIEYSPTKTTLSENARTHNERFGATAAGRADLKGSAGMPPLRQAAIPLAVSGRERCRKSGAY